MARAESNRPIFCDDFCRSLTAEAQIDAGANDVVGVLDIDKGRRQERELRVQPDPLGAEIVMAVFDEGREAGGEGVFTPPADCPARPIVACAVRRANHGCRCPVIAPLPGGSALYIEEGAVEGVAETAVDRGERLDVAVIE